MTELVHYSEDINLWQVATGCANTRGGSGSAGLDANLPWRILTGRKQATKYEHCIDVISVNEDVIHKFGIVISSDAKMIYPD